MLREQKIIYPHEVVLLDLIFINNFTYSWTGYLDNVKCFFCDGGLCNWEAEDEPWTEHARWFPDCGFLKQVKGMTFIQKVKVSSIFAQYYYIIGTRPDTRLPQSRAGGQEQYLSYIWQNTVSPKTAKT